MPPSLLYCLFVTVALAVRAASPPISFIADASAAPAALKFAILDCVGTGHAALALRADYRAHLTAVQRDIGFRSIRGHGILDDDVSTFLDGQANMINVFSILDFYLSVGITPTLELSFMPSELAANTSNTMMHYKAITSTPKDPAQWSAFISDFASALLERYGAEEVRRWRFEVWNELWIVPYAPFPPGGWPSYEMLYNLTARALLAADPLLSVGGPATAQLGHIPDFLNLTQSPGGPPAAFVSTHSYPTDYRHRNQSSLNRTLYEDYIFAAAAPVAAAGLPFLLTEVSAGLEGSAYDAPFAAAYIIHMAAAFLAYPNIEMLSFWTFTDIFEEPGFVSVPWAETYGIQTKYGIPKPSYRALQLLSDFPTAGIPVIASGSSEPRAFAWGGGSAAAASTATIGTVDVITAVDASAPPRVTLCALAVNYNLNVVDQEDPSTGLPIATEQVSITFTGLPAGAVLPAFASVALLSNTTATGWAKPVWLAAGSPLYPDAAELEAELLASQPGLLSVPVTAGPLPGQATVVLPALIPYAVASLRVDVIFPY